MWEPRRLTTLWTSAACYRDSVLYNNHVFICFEAHSPCYLIKFRYIIYEAIIDRFQFNVPLLLFVFKTLWHLCFRTNVCGEPHSSYIYLPASVLHVRQSCKLVLGISKKIIELPLIILVK
jgi:hypothetical protein